MAIAFDASSSTATSNLGLSSTSFNHTCTGSNLCLLVSVFNFGLGDVTTGVTYGGVAMTQLAKVATDATGYQYIYGLLAPPTGANAIVATASTPVNWYLSAASYTGVSQTGLPDASTGVSTSGTTSFSVSVTTVANNCWLVLGLRNSDGTGRTAGANTLVRVTCAASSDMGILDSNGARSIGSNALAYTTSNSTNGYHTMVSIAPVAAAGPTNLKSLDANLKANIKSYNGNVLANIKSISGNS